MIQEWDQRDAWVGSRDPDRNTDYERALGWHGTDFYESEMALISERMEYVWKKST